MGAWQQCQSQEIFLKGAIYMYVYMYIFEGLAYFLLVRESNMGILHRSQVWDMKE